MKRPILSRILAVLLLLISIPMLVSGFYGLYTASRDRRRSEAEIESLLDTAEEYRTVLALLDGTQDYDSLSRELGEGQTEQEKAAARHRQELANYTAIRGGLESGAEALTEAELALANGKAQYEASVIQFQIQEAAFQKLYEQALAGQEELNAGLVLLEAAERAVTALQNLSAALHNIGEIMDLNTEDPEENGEAMRLSALQAYDAALSLWAETTAVVETLQDQEIPVSLLRQMMESAGIDSSALPEDGSITLFTSEQVAEWKASLEGVLGMSEEEFLAKMQAERNAIAAGEGEYELNEDQFGTVRQAYSDNRDAIMRYADMLDQKLPEIEAMLRAAREKMDAAQKALAQIEESKKAIDLVRQALIAAGYQISEGELALQEGQAMLDKEQKKLDQQEEDLEKRKQNLDEEERRLKELGRQAEDQKQLEDRERTLRFSLLARPEIKERNQAGETVLSASENWISALKAKTTGNWEARFYACMLMILGFCLALVSVPTVFREQTEIALPMGAGLVCFLNAGGAFAFLIAAGRGSSLSAILCGAVALLFSFSFL